MVYQKFFDSVFASMDPERAHERAFAAIRIAGPGLARIPRRASAPRTVMGIDFPHPFGLAAGFDKNARAVPGLLGLGFSHVEIGTVTAQPQPGNPRPRLFRLVQDRAIVNRMGFNNDGAAQVASRLHRFRQRYGDQPVVGVNIGKTKVVPAAEAVADYVESARLLAPYASYLVVNVSSPNTPGLRDLQSVSSLGPILQAVRDSIGARPLVVKIAPDLADDDVDAIAELALKIGLDGVTATNTTIARPQTLRSSRTEIDATGSGGLSGPVLASRATEVLARLRSITGDQLALIGVGGLSSGSDVIDRLSQGADLVQAYTGFIYGGPDWPRQVVASAAAEKGIDAQ